MTDTPSELIYLTTMVDAQPDETNLYEKTEACNLVKEAIDKFTARHDPSWHSYAPTPATNYYLPGPSAMSSMDPMQILATLAFVAFLLQNLMALIDRLTMTTRIVQARSNNGKKFDKANEIHEAIKKFQNKKWD